MTCSCSLLTYSDSLYAEAMRVPVPRQMLAWLSGGDRMGRLTIRQLDERTHPRLRERAAAHGRPVEARSPGHPRRGSQYLRDRAAGAMAQL
ncbi:FitA-like ribbon-helix-helix domain-containing protein [Nostocoides australiense]